MTKVVRANVRACKDCGSTTRPLSTPGPRCATCHRARRAAIKQRVRELHQTRTYGLTPEQDRKLLEHQGGRCYICQRATGRTKALATDHDHKSGLIRGKLCGPCNKDLIGRYDAAALVRALKYLANPPALEAIGECYVPQED